MKTIPVYNSTANICEFEVEVSDPELADAFYDAWIWWNDFDRNYRIIFGHLTMELEETGTTGHCDCWLNQEDMDNGEPPYDYIDEPCSSIEHDVDEDVCVDTQIAVYSLVEKDYPGDGVMPAYSASSFLGAQASVLMDGSNHQQLRNDKNTKQAFFDMYHNVYGPKFYQDER